MKLHHDKANNNSPDDTKRAERERQINQQNGRIRAEVKTHLKNHEEIDTSSIKVSVNDGAVELQGEVDNAHAKSLAQSIASQEVPSARTVNADKLKPKRDASEAP